MHFSCVIPYYPLSLIQQLGRDRRRVEVQPSGWATGAAGSDLAARPGMAETPARAAGNWAPLHWGVC